MGNKIKKKIAQNINLLKYSRYSILIHHLPYLFFCFVLYLKIKKTKKVQILIFNAHERVKSKFVIARLGGSDKRIA